ncbi:MAG: hypothetical protein RPS47_12660 [Colwellia sp.]
MFTRILKLFFLMNLLIGVTVSIIPVTTYLKSSNSSFSPTRMAETLLDNRNISNNPSNETVQTNGDSLSILSLLYSGDVDLNSSSAFEAITSQGGSPQSVVSKIDDLKNKLPSNYLLLNTEGAVVTSTIQSLLNIYTGDHSPPSPEQK